jgi:hypothetical protein
MKVRSEERVAELGKLLKGKIKTSWVKSGENVEVSRVLLDESYREPFDELIGLLRHREEVVACLVRQVAERKANREPKERSYQGR